MKKWEIREANGNLIGNIEADKYSLYCDYPETDIIGKFYKDTDDGWTLIHSVPADKVIVKLLI